MSIELRTTNIPWIRGARIPAHWKESRVRYLAQSLQAGESITAEDIEPQGRYPVYGGNGLRGYTDSFTHHGTRLLIGRQGALCGNVHLVGGQFWASEHALVAEPAPHVDARWLGHVLDIMNLGQYSQSSAQPGIGASQVRALALPVPPPDEQRAIADYLDHETAKIDALIEKQERLIAALRERSAGFREHHLLGRADARSTSVRRALARVSRPAVPGLEVITAYRDGRVTRRSNRRDDGYTMSDLEHGYQEIRPGEIVFHALDGFAGAVGVSDSHGNATPVYHVCTPTQDDDAEFIALYLRQLGTSGLLSTLAPNVRQRSVDFRNWSTFGRVPLELPEPQAQRDAVRAIQTSERQIDELIEKAERLIKLSGERRAALIAAAVTGQIDVPGAA